MDPPHAAKNTTALTERSCAGFILFSLQKVADRTVHELHARSQPGQSYKQATPSLQFVRNLRPRSPLCSGHVREPPTKGWATNPRRAGKDRLLFSSINYFSYHPSRIPVAALETPTPRPRNEGPTALGRRLRRRTRLSRPLRAVDNIASFHSSRTGRCCMRWDHSHDNDPRCRPDPPGSG